MRIKGLLEANNRLVGAAAKLQKRELRALRRAALLTERELKKGLLSGAPGGQKFKPLGPITKLLRKGRKPLIDRADMLGSIKTTVEESSFSAFVGVHRSAGRSSGGTDVVNVAAVHEFGTEPFVIPVTPGIRRFFLALSFLSKGAISPLSARTPVLIHPGVPARPFIRPTIEKILPKLQKVVTVTISENGGPF